MTELERNLIQRLNVGDALTRTAWRAPEKEAVVDGDRRLSYRELNAATNRLANALLARGIGRGDPVLLMAGNCVEFVESYYALAKIGAIAVPINLLWGPNEVGYVIEHCRPKLALVEPPFAEVVGGLEKLVTPFELGDAGDAEPECLVEDRDPLGYMYTSGTTSHPKGVVQTHMNVYMNSLTVSMWLHAAADWRYGIFMPLFHTAALGVATTAILQGATAVLMRGFDPPALLDAIERERLTYFFGLPMMIRALMETPGFAERDVSSLDTIGYAMAPMPDEDLRRAMAAFGCNFTLGFGQTEMAPLTTVFAHEDQLAYAGSVGRQIPNVQTAIMDEDGNLLPAGESGEIVYRSPQAMAGYLHDEDASDDAFRHGWFHSGDVGHFDADGVLWFEDRKKDVIKTGGENVASIEVERALYDAEPRILECVVIGLPHERWGEAITAVVTPRPGETLSEDEVIDAAKRLLPSFKAPKQVVFIEELPRTSTGKIQKNVLRELLSRVHA